MLTFGTFLTLTMIQKMDRRMCFFQLRRAKIRTHEGVIPITLLQFFLAAVETTLPQTGVAVMFSLLNQLEANGADMPSTPLVDLLGTNNDIQVIDMLFFSF